MIEIANAPPLARYRFRVRATQPLKLPDFAGSMLRGAFGRSLRKLACMTRRPECKGCPLITTRVFYWKTFKVSAGLRPSQRIATPPPWSAII